MDFSIIIPVRNRPDEIRAAVASCYAQDYPPTRYEVIVVDNGSDDQTARAAAGAGARIVSEPVPNRCRARNAGAAVARGRWLAFMDSDCEADPGWLTALAAAEASSPGGSMAGAIVAGPARGSVEAYIAARGWLDQERFLQPGRRFAPPFAATANLAIRREVFEAVGGFDPDLPIAGEDADWCWRAAEAGHAIQYVPAARVTHHHRATLRGMMRQAYNYGVGNADLFAKHGAASGASVWIEPNHYVWAAKGLLKAPFAFARRPTPERYFAWYDFLTNIAQAAGRVRGGIKHGKIVI